MQGTGHNTRHGRRASCQRLYNITSLSFRWCHFVKPNLISPRGNLNVFFFPNQMNRLYFCEFYITSYILVLPSVVGHVWAVIAQSLSRYGMDVLGSNPGGGFLAPVQTGSGTHPASYTMRTGSLQGIRRPGRGVNHAPHPQPEVRERLELYV